MKTTETKRDTDVEARVDRSYLWNFAVGVLMLVMYYLHPESPDRIVWLFAATFCVIHGAANKVISYLKAEREVRRRHESQ